MQSNKILTLLLVAFCIISCGRLAFHKKPTVLYSYKLEDDWLVLFDSSQLITNKSQLKKFFPERNFLTHAIGNKGNALVLRRLISSSAPLSLNTSTLPGAFTSVRVSHVIIKEFLIEVPIRGKSSFSINNRQIKSSNYIYVLHSAGSFKERNIHDGFINGYQVNDTIWHITAKINLSMAYAPKDYFEKVTIDNDVIIKTEPLITKLK